MTWTYYRFTPESNVAKGAEGELLAGLSKLSPEQARTALTVIYHDGDEKTGLRHPVLIYNDSPGSGAPAQDLPVGWGHLLYNPAKDYEATLGAICDLLNGKPLQAAGQTITLDASQASLVRCVAFYLTTPPATTPSPYLAIYYPKSTQQASPPSSKPPPPPPPPSTTIFPLPGQWRTTDGRYTMTISPTGDANKVTIQWDNYPGLSSASGEIINSRSVGFLNQGADNEFHAFLLLAATGEKIHLQPIPPGGTIPSSDWIRVS